MAKIVGAIIIYPKRCFHINSIQRDRVVLVWKEFKASGWIATTTTVARFISRGNAS